ncbi:MAG TPA: hypothetical protein VES95_05270 [Dermatophilaceae bacterium]|nr:hypothetical protein [Dermatophilaceae bacterium]
MEGSREDRWAMADDCPMTEECPGFDRERRVCLLRPEDCEFAPPDGGYAATIRTLPAPTPGAPETSGPP